MENLENTNIIYLLLLFMPGFIFIKVDSLLIASNENDFSKQWYEAIAYGTIFSGLTYLTYLIGHNYFPIYGFLLVGMVCMPAIMPYVLTKLRSKAFLHKYLLRPEVSAWDYIFSSRKSYWVILHLKDGINIAGLYSKKSYTSAFPYKQDIYLEELWTLDDDNKFSKKVPRSAGLWISANEISSIEFFTYEEESTNDN